MTLEALAEFVLTVAIGVHLGHLAMWLEDRL